MQEMENRNTIIVNVSLSIFKAIVGMMANSIAISLGAKDRKAVFQKAYSTVQALYLDYNINIVVDTNYAKV